MKPHNLLIISITFFLILIYAECSKKDPDDEYTDELIRVAKRLGEKLKTDSKALQEKMDEQTGKVLEWEKVYTEGKSTCENIIKDWRVHFEKVMRKIDKLNLKEGENLKGFKEIKRKLVIDIMDRLEKSEDFMEKFNILTASMAMLRADAMNEMSNHGRVLAEFLSRKEDIGDLIKEIEEDADEARAKKYEARLNEVTSLKTIHDLVINVYQNIDETFHGIEEKVDNMKRGTEICKDKLESTREIQDFIEQVENAKDMKKVSKLILEILDEDETGEKKGYVDPTKLIKLDDELLDRVIDEL